MVASAFMLTDGFGEQLTLLDYCFLAPRVMCTLLCVERGEGGCESRGEEVLTRRKSGAAS